MKLKVKFRDSKKFYEASDLEELHRKVTEENNFSELVILSLNGRDPIPNVGSFSANDIVPGTLTN